MSNSGPTAMPKVYIDQLEPVIILASQSIIEEVVTEVLAMINSECRNGTEAFQVAKNDDTAGLCPRLAGLEITSSSNSDTSPSSEVLRQPYPGRPDPYLLDTDGLASRMSDKKIEWANEMTCTIVEIVERWAAVLTRAGICI
ncbi:hypothetical protein GLAREA_04138 [Glarea lozoyensis ATCC 20868]|uniref:Uncharacterized protein n=1 Tax=Glarea lozoyensis (strain ATCC 20868 / MF5171) TaxID=1116229 RepID=S3DGL0_GLAL2|nr:uncharacterized protein GLAREA_04138 [Glarea lozoyensis ATCC 20868]EPE31171.1 hypothetical protein GLAREA_04138 [Glarea lozoyensis ATCC 20868]